MLCVKQPIEQTLCSVQHTDLLKSLEDPNTYLVNSTGDPLQQSLSGLLLDGLPPSASAAFLPKGGMPSGFLFFSFLTGMC